MTATVVRDNPDQSRYEVLDDDQLAGFAQYTLRGSIAEFFHTETFPAFEGRGLASRLVGGALDDARRRGWQVRPSCPYVRGFIARHGEYLDLVPPAERARFGLETR